jgi:uncharacterized LabA/DUF88 family protein
MKSIAILLDGGFVCRRLYKLLKNRHATADDVVRLSEAVVDENEDLFRIYYYDCPPYTGKKSNPLLKKLIDFDATPTARRMKSLHDSLAQKDHVAFRRGELHFNGWAFNPRITEDLIHSTTSKLIQNGMTLNVSIDLDLVGLVAKGLLEAKDLPVKEPDLARIVNLIVTPEIKQKHVDIKIGLDVAWLASRRIVDRIALVTADTDFIPAMKFARREGVQVILVPLGQKPARSLAEHADEVRHFDFGPVHSAEPEVSP